MFKAQQKVKANSLRSNINEKRIRQSKNKSNIPIHNYLIICLAAVIIFSCTIATLSLSTVQIQAAERKPLPNPLPAPGSLPAIKELPDPFKFFDGTRMTSYEQWSNRREELSELIQYYETGHLPKTETKTTATRNGKNLTVNVESGGKSASFKVTLNVPSSVEPIPAIICANSITGNLTSRGYALVNFNPNDIAADSTTKNGAFWKLYPDSDAGVLMAWAWGYHRILDALKFVSEIDTTKVGVTGFSRYGKAALIAGAFDERIALTIPSSSGPGGMANFRFYFPMGTYSEKFENILEAAYWFTPRFSNFRNQVTKLPFDQHSIAALVAPRLLLVTNGTEDPYTNPQGTSYTYRAAKMVYQYLGVPERIGINFRPGTHAASEDDGKAIGDFADKFLKGKTVTRSFDNNSYQNNTAAIPWTIPNGGSTN